MLIVRSLQLKIESLKAERERSGQLDYGLSHTESPAPLTKSEDIEFSVKEEAKDGLSAGSFTLDIRTNQSPESQVPAIPSATETVVKLEPLESWEQDKAPSTSKVTEAANGNGGAVRKRRGKRRRKDSVWDAKEGSIEDSDNVCSTSLASTSHCKEILTSCDQSIRHSAVSNHRGCLSRFRNDDLMRIFNSITQHEAAMVFRHRLDSQKRARYKKIIRRHMDIETARSRLANWSIKTPGELFRDFLLLANNAMVFYSKRTREYKSAMALRDIVTKVYREHYKDSYYKATSSLLPWPTIGNPPGKPRSVRPRPSKDKLQAKYGNNVKDIIGGTLGKQNHKAVDADSKVPLQSFLSAKKGFKRPGKIKCGSTIETVNPQPKVQAKEPSQHNIKVKKDHRVKPVTKERKRARQK
ncbi:putative organ-specific protein S2-like [Capsicum annuum]|nr:putative organ-specific protein S2-like [Capsicum annuum]